MCSKCQRISVWTLPTLSPTVSPEAKMGQSRLSRCVEDVGFKKCGQELQPQQVSGCPAYQRIRIATLLAVLPSDGELLGIERLPCGRRHLRTGVLPKSYLQALTFRRASLATVFGSTWLAFAIASQGLRQHQNLTRRSIGNLSLKFLRYTVGHIP